LKIEFDIFFRDYHCFFYRVAVIFWENHFLSRFDKWPRGLAKQSVFTAIETMNGQTFDKRGDGEDRQWGKNDEKKRVIIGETNVVPSRAVSCRLTRLFESKKEMSSMMEGKAQRPETRT